MTERTVSAEEREEALAAAGAAEVGAAFDATFENAGYWMPLLSRALLAEHERNARLSAWVSGDVAKARELADGLAEVRYAPPTWVAARAAEIVALLTPKDTE